MISIIISISISIIVFVIIIIITTTTTTTIVTTIITTIVIAILITVMITTIMITTIITSFITRPSGAAAPRKTARTEVPPAALAQPGKKRNRRGVGRRLSHVLFCGLCGFPVVFHALTELHRISTEVPPARPGTALADQDTVNFQTKNL